MQEVEAIEAKVLGKRTDYPQNYSPDILVAVPRRLNRKLYGIEDERLPFVGTDSWHAYELSFLNRNGLPVTGLLKLNYAASTKCLVESKSLKLYLNSFNMERFESVEDVEHRISVDLSAVVGGEVGVRLFFEGDGNVRSDDSLEGFAVLEKMPMAGELVIDKYVEAPEVLQEQEGAKEVRYCSHLLRSNCKITHQPDWGTIYVAMKGEKVPAADSLLRYIVSLRGENHFHEEICEMVFVRLMRRFLPKELMVTCVYTRRGGIDICPMRATSEELLPKVLGRSDVLTSKLLRQ